MVGWLAKTTARWRMTPYDVVRVLVAVLLLTAAALKAHQLATEPLLGRSILDSRLVLTGTVEFELFFGLWLLANPWPRVGWVAALACFCIFGCVSLCKALSGYNTCGCFGRIVVNPFITATLDWVVVCALLRWRSVGQGSPFTALSKKLISRLTLVLASWICFGVPMAVAAVGYGPARLGNDGLIVDDGSNLVVIDPIAWAGLPIPLLPYIDDSPDLTEQPTRPLRTRLAEGDWIVVLYRHDCRTLP